MKKQKLMLGNLTCPNCAAKLEEAAAGLPGMKTAMVAFGTGTLTVEYDESRCNEAAVRTIVRQLGLDVTMVL
jgi:copper chaperone CopZ